MSCDNLMDSLLKWKNNLVRKKEGTTEKNCSGEAKWFKDLQNLEMENPSCQIWDVRHCAVIYGECVCVLVFVCFWVVALRGLTIRTGRHVRQLQWETRASEFSWPRARSWSRTHSYPDGGVVVALLCVQQRSRAAACAELQLQAAVVLDGSTGVPQCSRQQHVPLAALTQTVVQASGTVQRKRCICRDVWEKHNESIMDPFACLYISDTVLYI